MLAIIITYMAMSLQSPALSEDQYSLLGTWDLIALVADGEEISRDTIKGLGAFQTFKGDEFMGALGDGSKVRGSFHWDQTKLPWTLDIITDGEREIYPAIYKLNQDILIICYGEQDRRPTEFTSKIGSRRKLLTFKRRTRGEKTAG